MRIDPSWVIPEVDTALRSLLGALLPAGSTVRLGPPPPPDEHPVLNLFLAEIRVDTRAMASDWDNVRDEDGVLLGRRPPVRRFDLSYLVTAWAPDERLQGELLDAVLLGVAPERRIDPALFGGPLSEDDAPPVTIRFADSPAALHREHGLPPRTVLGLIVNAPLVRPMDTDLAEPAERITLAVDRGVRRGPPTRTPPRRGAWQAARITEDEPAPAAPVPGAPDSPGKGA